MAAPNVNGRLQVFTKNLQLFFVPVWVDSVGWDIVDIAHIIWPCTADIQKQIT